MSTGYGWSPAKNYLEVVNNYEGVCLEASKNDDVFNNFKSIQDYTNVLEHCTKDQGVYYINQIEKLSKESFISNLDKLKENDLYGNPVVYNYPEYGKFSPTTLRYIKNCFEMASLVGETEISKVVEIGGGYGGLCKTLDSLCEFDSYINIDLPNVSLLQERYIKNFPDLYKKCIFTPCNECVKIENVDLFISNYAFSECDWETQMDYYDKIISQSKFIYVVYNTVVYQNYNLKQFINKVQKNFSISTHLDLENMVIMGKLKN